MLTYEEEIGPETVEEDENLIACDEETEQQAALIFPFPAGLAFRNGI